MRNFLLSSIFAFTGAYISLPAKAQDFGTAGNGLPNCSPDYDGSRELGMDDRTYGWDVTDQSTGELNTCVVTTGRISPVKQCINLGGDLESDILEDGTVIDFGYNISADDLDEVVAAGFDSVRIPVNWADNTGAGPRFRINRRFWREVDTAVNLSLERGLNVIIDVHHFDEFNTDPDGERAKLFQIWRQLSSHYRNFDANLPENPETGLRPRLIFELLNEPHFENVNGEDIDFVPNRTRGPSGIERINRINRELLRLIRRQNPGRWVIVGSSQFGSIGPIEGGPNGEFFVPPPNDRRVITTAHYYDPLEFTHQRLEFDDSHPNLFRPAWGSRRQRNQVARDFNRVSDWQSTTGRNYPFLLGEFGTSARSSGQLGTPVAQRRNYANVVRQQAERRNFGWCYWDLGSIGFGIFDPETNRYRDRIINQLIP